MASLIAVSSPFSLSAAPAHLDMQPGQQAQVRIADTGTIPLDLAVSVQALRSGCSVSPGQPDGITVTPASVSLQPGQIQAVTVAVSPSAPAQDDAVIFASQPGNGGMQATGAVGTQLVVGTAADCHPPAAAGPSGGRVIAAKGNTSDLVYLWLLTLLAIPALIVLRWRTKRARRSL